MILDSEKQRKLLLEIINKIPVSGLRQDVKKFIIETDELELAIKEAKIECRE